MTLDANIDAVVPADWPLVVEKRFATKREADEWSQSTYQKHSLAAGRRREDGMGAYGEGIRHAEGSTDWIGYVRYAANLPIVEVRRGADS